MAFKDFHDTRYKDARRLLIGSVAGVALTAGGLTALLWFSEPQTTEPAKVVVRAPPEPEPEPAPTPEPTLSSTDRFELAKRAFASGDLNKTREFVQEIDLVQLGSPFAWELAGFLQSHFGDKKAAMSTFTQGLASAPSAQLHYRRGVLYREEGDFEHAWEDFDRASRLDRTDFTISNERLMLLTQMGRNDQVREEILAQTTTGLPADIKAWVFGLCALALEKGQYPEAAKLLAFAQKNMDRQAFQRLLANPVILRHQNEPEIFSYYFTNIGKEP